MRHHKCIACDNTSNDFLIYEAFEGIYYCEECMEKYKLPLPDEGNIDSSFDWDII